MGSANDRSKSDLDRSYTSTSSGPLPKYSDQFFDFFSAAKIIIQLQQIKGLQKQYSEKRQQDQYLMNQFIISQELDQKEVYVKKIIPDEMGPFRIFAEYFTFSECDEVANLVK